MLSPSIPQILRNSISNKIEDSILLSKLFKKLKWEKELAIEYSFAMLLMFLSLWGFSISVRYLFSMFYKSSYLLSASLLGLIVLVFYKWDEKPDFLKISLYALIPLVFLTFFLGYLGELRDYYEIYSAVIILILYSIAKILDLEIKIPTR